MAVCEERPSGNALFPGNGRDTLLQLDKAERDSVLDRALDPTEAALGHGPCASSAAGAVNTSSALVAKAAHAPARGHPLWLLPVSARAFTLVAKNRARGFCSARAGSSSPSSQVDKIPQTWSSAPSKCSMQVEKYVRGRIMWPLAGLFEVCWVALSRILRCIVPSSASRFPSSPA